MIKLTYKDIDSLPLADAMKKLNAVPGWKDSDFVRNIIKINRRLKKELEEAGETYRALLKGHCELNVENEIILDEKGQPKIKNMDEWESALTKFNATVVELDCHPILLSKLENTNLSASDVMALEPLLDLLL